MKYFTGLLFAVSFFCSCLGSLSLLAAEGTSREETEEFLKKVKNRFYNTPMKRMDKTYRKLEERLDEVWDYYRYALRERKYNKSEEDPSILLNLMTSSDFASMDEVLTLEKKFPKIKKTLSMYLSNDELSMIEKKICDSIEEVPDGELTLLKLMIMQMWDHRRSEAMATYYKSRSEYRDRSKKRSLERHFVSTYHEKPKKKLRKIEPRVLGKESN